jgi:hypothetical protein
MWGCHSVDARSASRLKRARYSGVGGHLRPKHLQGAATRQPRMISQVDLPHSASTQQAHDPEASKSFTRAQWHEPHTTNSGRMSDAAERLAQAIRDVINDAVEAAVARLEPRAPSVPPPLKAPAERTWLSRKQVAARLNVPVATLTNWASQRRRPSYGKFGRYTRYRPDVITWEEQQRQA